MPAEIQITNRNAVTPKRVTATLRDSDSGEVMLDFLIGPGEAVIVPMLTTMTLTVTLAAAEEGASAAAE